MAVVALVAAGSGQATTSTAVPFSKFKSAMWDQYHWTNRALGNRCREKFHGMDEFTSTVPLRDVLPSWRDDKIRWAKGKHHRAQEKSSLCVPWYITKQINIAWKIANESQGDPWPNCPDPGPRDNQGPGHSWYDTVACENGGSWLDSPGYYRCGLQFDPGWETVYGRLCP